MPQITYKNVTEGQAFGDAGSIFRGASKSIDRSIALAKDAVSSVAKGQEAVTRQNTQDALTQIQGIASPEEHAALQDTFTDQSTVQSEFGDVNANKLIQAFRNQESIAKSKQANKLAETVNAETVGLDGNQILGQITPETTPQKAKALKAQAMKRFEENNQIFQKKDQLRANTEKQLIDSSTYGLPAVMPEDSYVDYKAKAEQLNSALKDIQGKVSSTTLANVKRDQQAALGINPQEGLRRLFSTMVDPNTGEILPEYTIKDKDTGVDKFSFNQFSKQALADGYTIPEISSFKKVVNDFTGETARILEQQRQKIRAENLQEFKDKESYKQLIKNNDPALVDGALEFLDDSDDWLGFSESSKTEAVEAVVIAKKKYPSLSNSQLKRAIRASTEDDDFSSNTFGDVVKLIMGTTVNTTAPETQQEPLEEKNWFSRTFLTR